MAQANSNDSDTNDNSDISSQLSEIKESYERRISELHHEFSQLKDLMMAIVNKSNAEVQPSSSKSPSKPPQQQGFDMVTGVTENPPHPPVIQLHKLPTISRRRHGRRRRINSQKQRRTAVERHRDDPATDKKHYHKYKTTANTRTEFQRTKRQIRGI